jgi:hypothetical protein
MRESDATARPADATSAPWATIEAYRTFTALARTETRTSLAHNILFQLVHVGLFTVLAWFLADVRNTLLDCDPHDLAAEAFTTYALSLLGLCLIGLLSGVSWLLMIWRSGRINDSILSRLQAIETHLYGADSPLLAYAQWRRELARGTSRFGRLRLSQIWAGLAVVFVAIWLAAVVLVANEQPLLSAACLPSSNNPADSASAASHLARGLAPATTR